MWGGLPWRTQLAAAADATTTATRKRAQHTSDGRNSSDGTSHGQAKRGRVVLNKGKARASIEGLEIQNAREMAKERAKDTHIPPSCAASDSGAAQTTSKPEGTIDTSLSMEMDEDDVNLAADRSTQLWMTDLPSLLSSSLSLSSAESRSPFQNRMPPPPVPLAAKLLAAKANGYPSRRLSVGVGGSGASRSTTSFMVLVPT